MKTKDVFLGFGLSLILALSYSFFHYAKLHNDTFEVSVIACSDNLKDNSLSLYYDIGQGFSESNKSNFIRSKNKYTAQIILTEKHFLKTIRLDIDEVDSFCLRQLTLYDKEHKKIYDLKAEKIKDNIVHLSDGILNIKEKGDLILIETNRVDPYFFLKPNFFISSSEIIISLLLILPYVFFLIRYFLINKMKDVTITTFILSSIIISIPLKDSLTSFATIIFVLFVGYNIFIKKNKIMLSPMISLIFLFIIPTTYGVFGGINENYGIRLGAVIFPLGFSFIHLERMELIKIYKIYSNFMLIVSLYVISVFLLYLIVGEVDLEYVLINKQKIRTQSFFRYLGYNHPTFLAVFMIIGFVFKWFEKHNKIDADIVLYFIAILIFCIITSARTTLFSLFFVMSVLIFLKKLKFVGFSLLTMFSMGIIFGGVYYFDEFRMEMWTLMLDNSNWILGNGFASNEKVILETLGFKFHPHNQFLLWFYDFGILGLLFYSLLLIYLLYTFVKNKYLAGVIILLLVNILMMTEAPFETSKPVFILSFLLSLVSLEMFCSANHNNVKEK